MPKFSIITICYNEPRLDDTCKTIVNQTFQDFEWIVMDGGSNQKTLDIFEKYKNRINYFTSEKDNGRYNAMNKGIRQAHGDYLIFMNAGDCFYESQTLEKVAATIQNQTADIFYGNGYMRKDDKINLYQSPEQLSKDFLYEGSLFHQAMFYRKDVFQKYGFYDENLKIVADWKHYLDVFVRGGIFAYIPLNIAVDDDGGISASAYQLCQKERRLVLEKMIGKDGADAVDKKLWENKKRFSDIVNLMKKKRALLQNPSMDFKPKISVIIPVYNAHDYLERCLDSVCNQTLKEIEIICVDDHSVDDSLDILNTYSQKYPQIKVITHTQNAGESAARNTGIKNATGEYLAFVDNDDTIDPDFYEKLYHKAKSESADIAKANVHMFQPDGQATDGELNPKIEMGDKFYFAYHWWTAIYKRELIEANHLCLPEGYPLGGDVLFLNKVVLLANKIVTINDTFYNYYKRDDSGDSSILSDAKIHSAIDIFFMIADNMIASGIKTPGVSFNLTAWLAQILHYPFRVKELSTMRYILHKANEYYQKTKEYIDENSPKVFPVVLNLLKQNDDEKLIQFYLKYNSPSKMFIANLRYLHSQKKGTP